MKQTNKSKNQTKRVQVSFSPTTYKLIRDRADKVGLPMAEYLRYSALNSSFIGSEYIEELDDETYNNVAKGFEDIKNGRVSDAMLVEDAIQYLKRKNAHT